MIEKITQWKMSWKKRMHRSNVWESLDGHLVFYRMLVKLFLKLFPLTSLWNIPFWNLSSLWSGACGSHLYPILNHVSLIWACRGLHSLLSYFWLNLINFDVLMMTHTVYPQENMDPCSQRCHVALPTQNNSKKKDQSKNSFSAVSSGKGGNWEAVTNRFIT